MIICHAVPQWCYQEAILNLSTESRTSSDRQLTFTTSSTSKSSVSTKVTITQPANPSPSIATTTIHFSSTTDEFPQISPPANSSGVNLDIGFILLPGDGESISSSTTTVSTTKNVKTERVVTTTKTLKSDATSTTSELFPEFTLPPNATATPSDIGFILLPGDGESTSADSTATDSAVSSEATLKSDATSTTSELFPEFTLPPNATATPSDIGFILDPGATDTSSPTTTQPSTESATTTTIDRVPTLIVILPNNETSASATTSVTTETLFVPLPVNATNVPSDIGFTISGGSELTSEQATQTSTSQPIATESAGTSIISTSVLTTLSPTTVGEVNITSITTSLTVSATSTQGLVVQVFNTDGAVGNVSVVLTSLTSTISSEATPTVTTEQANQTVTTTTIGSAQSAEPVNSDESTPSTSSEALGIVTVSPDLTENTTRTAGSLSPTPSPGEQLKPSGSVQGNETSVQGASSPSESEPPQGKPHNVSDAAPEGETDSPIIPPNPNTNNGGVDTTGQNNLAPFSSYNLTPSTAIQASSGLETTEQTTVITNQQTMGMSTSPINDSSKYETYLGTAGQLLQSFVKRGLEGARSWKRRLRR